MRKKNSARFTLDIPYGKHRRLKILSMIRGVSMRAMLEEAFDEQIKKYENQLTVAEKLDSFVDTL